MHSPVLWEHQPSPGTAIFLIVGKFISKKGCLQQISWTLKEWSDDSDELWRSYRPINPSFSHTYILWTHDESRFVVGGGAYSQLAPHDDSAGSEAFRMNRLRKLGTLLACLPNLLRLLTFWHSLPPWLQIEFHHQPRQSLSPFDTQLIQDH